MYEKINNKEKSQKYRKNAHLNRDGQIAMAPNQDPW